LIPAELRALKGWLLWKLVASDQPGGKPRKVPCYIDGGQRSGKQGGDADRGRWATYDEAVRVLDADTEGAGKYEGLGFALSPDWGVVGLDFDNCVDAAGRLQPQVSALISGTYAEFSPSGTGVHAFLRGKLTDRKSSAAEHGWGFETFCEKGFLTVTGQETPGCELAGCDTLDHLNGAVTELFEQRFGAGAIVVAGGGGGAGAGAATEGLTDDQLRDLLKWHNADAPYDGKSLSEGSWLRVGMALHHETDGGARGLDLWDEWSAQGAKYAGRALIESKWSGFGDGASLVTAKWIRIVAEARSNGLAIDASGFDVIVDDPADPPPLPTFTRDRAGAILPTMDNIVKAVERPDLMGVRIGHDEFRDEIAVAAGSVDGPGGPGWIPMSDAESVQLRITLERMRFKSVPREMVRDAVTLVASRNRFDSAGLWLGGLQWDGVPRVGAFLSTYLGCDESSEYARAVSMYLWTALAGRVLEPGCKADMVPIFEGSQGLRKSSAIEAMSPAPEFFVEVDLGEKEEETVRKLRGALIGEIAELSGLHTRDLEGIKKFVVRKVEKWVPKYKEFASTFKRRLIFIGTTNKNEILADETGNRRWLPVHIERADAEAIARDRDQLWAEGAALFLGKLPTVHAGGVAWQEAERLADEEHPVYLMTDAWDERVADWLAEADEMEPGTCARGAAPFTTAGVLSGALHLSSREMNRATSNRVGSILRRLGYDSTTVRRGPAIFRAWKLKSVA
jgi:predicted P-loop ATPase